MTFRRGGARGSRYSQKINPTTIYIAYEGAVDEKHYLQALQHSIPKRFSQLLRLEVVEKSSTKSAPQYVLDDLINRLNTQNVKLNKGDNYAFILIDKDHYFDNNHVKETRQTIRNCKDKNIQVLCSAPSFEVWLLCHYLDIAAQDKAFKQQAWKNKKSSKNGDSFLKQQVNQRRRGESYSNMLKRLNTAQQNEAKLQIDANGNNIKQQLPPTQLFSNIGEIITLMQSSGIILT